MARFWPYEGVAAVDNYCGDIYRPTYQGTTVVYVVEDIDAGTGTNVEFEE